MFLLCGKPATLAIRRLPERSTRTRGAKRMVGFKGEGGLTAFSISSGEVMIVPPLPTATNRLPENATEYKLLFVPELLSVQIWPLSEVKIVPFSPALIHSLPVQSTENRSFKDRVFKIQSTPSNDVSTSLPLGGYFFILDYWIAQFYIYLKIMSKITQYLE